MTVTETQWKNLVAEKEKLERRVFVLEQLYSPERSHLYTPEGYLRDERFPHLLGDVTNVAGTTEVRMSSLRGFLVAEVDDPNTTNEYSLFSKTFYANTIPPGCLFRVQLFGEYTQTAVPGEQHTIRMKFGGSTIHTFTTVIEAGTFLWKLVWETTLRTNGASGTAVSFNFSWFNNTLQQQHANTFAVDTTANIVIEVTNQMGHASNCGFATRSGWIEVFGGA